MGFSLNLFILFNYETQEIFNHETEAWLDINYLVDVASDDTKWQCFTSDDIYRDGDIRKFSIVEMNVGDPKRKRNMGISPGLFMIYNNKVSTVFNLETGAWLDAAYIANEASDEVKLQCLMTNCPLDDPVLGDLFLDDSGMPSFMHKKNKDVTVRMFSLVESIFEVK